MILKKLIKLTLQVKPARVLCSRYKSCSYEDNRELELIFERNLQLKQKECETFTRSVKLLSALQEKNGLHMTKEDICNVIEIYRQYGCENLVRSNEALLFFDLSKLRSILQFYKETGVENLQAAHLLSYRLIAKQPVKYLKDIKLLPPDVNVMFNYCSYFQKFSDQLKQDMNAMSIENDELSLLDMQDMVLKRYSYLKFGTFYPFPKKFYRTIQDFEALLDEFGAVVSDANEIRFNKFRDILKLDASNLKRWKETLPKLLNYDFATLIKTYPAIFLQTPEQVNERLSCFENKLKIPYFLINMPMMTMKEETLQLRIDYWTSIFGKDVFVKYPKAIRVFTEHWKAKLNFERTIGSHHNEFPRELLLDILFEKKEVKSINGRVSKLCSMFNLEDSKSICETLRKNKLFQFLREQNAINVFNYLLKQNLTIEQIVRSIYIILYEYEAVVDTFQNTKQSAEFDEWKNHSLLLDYIVYKLELKIKLDGLPHNNLINV